MSVYILRKDPRSTKNALEALEKCFKFMHSCHQRMAMTLATEQHWRKRERERSYGLKKKDISTEFKATKILVNDASLPNTILPNINDPSVLNIILLICRVIF